MIDIAPASPDVAWAAIRTAVKATKTGSPAAETVTLGKYQLQVACKLLTPEDVRYKTGGHVLVMLRVDVTASKNAGADVHDQAVDWLLIQQEAALGALVLPTFPDRKPPCPGQDLRHCLDFGDGIHIKTQDRWRTALWTVQR